MGPPTGAFAAATVAAVLLLSALPGRVDAGTLQATATYRERMMPPPGSLLEVVLEDTARADAPARPVARARRELSSGPPYEVRLDFDDAAIVPTGRYAVRARITHEGRLLWTTTTIAPVLRGGPSDTGQPLTLMLVRVGARPTGPGAGEGPPPAGRAASGPVGASSGARRPWVDVPVPVAPGRWSGVVPTATAVGQRWTLDLFATGGLNDTAPTGLRFEWRQQHLEPADARPSDDLGLVMPDGDRLRLVGASGEPRWLLLDGDDLRLLDRSGRPVETGLPMVLKREPAALRGPSRLRLPLRGEFAAVADAPVMRLCADGRRLPVALDGDYLSAERAWRAAGRPPGDAVLLEFDGAVEPRPSADPGVPGEVITVVVRRLRAAWPRETCGNPVSDAALLGTYWRLVRLDGRAVAVAPRQREAHLVLQASGDGVRLAGHGGCNRLTGGAETTGDGTLRFGGIASTRMACPAGDDTEPRFLQALSRTAGFRIAGSHLDLLDASSQLLARLEAVALR